MLLTYKLEIRHLRELEHYKAGTGVLEALMDQPWPGAYDASIAGTACEGWQIISAWNAAWDKTCPGLMTHGPSMNPARCVLTVWNATGNDLRDERCRVGEVKLLQERNGSVLRRVRGVRAVGDDINALIEAYENGNVSP